MGSERTSAAAPLRPFNPRPCGGKFGCGCEQCQKKDLVHSAAAERLSDRTHPGTGLGHQPVDFSQVPIRAAQAAAHGLGEDVALDAAHDAPLKDNGGIGALIGGLAGVGLGAGLGALVGGPLGALAGGLIGGAVGAIAGGIIGSTVPKKKTKQLHAVKLEGASRSPSTDVANADKIWSQCGLGVGLAGTTTIKADLLDTDAPTGVLNEFSDPASPTTEEVAMLGNQPGGSGTLHAYFVPSMSAGSRGEAFLSSITPSLPEALVVSDSGAVDTLAHELGHVVLGEAGHSTDPDNLMASGDIRNVGVDKLDSTQCAKA